MNAELHEYELRPRDPSIPANSVAAVAAEAEGETELVLVKVTCHDDLSAAAVEATRRIAEEGLGEGRAGRRPKRHFSAINVLSISGSVRTQVDL